MNWKPNRTLGAWMGLFAIFTIVGVISYIISALRALPFGPGSYLTALLLTACIPLLGAVGYWMYGLLTLSYQLDRSQLIIRSGHSHYTIPISSISRLVTGEQLGQELRFAGIGWPGYMMGRIQLQDGSQVITNATEPFPRQFVIITSQGNYGISPSDANGFIDELRRMLGEGATRIVEHAYGRDRIAALPLWRDKGFWGALLVGLLVNLALWGLIAFMYAGLPGRLPLQFNPQGGIGAISPKEGVLLVPLIGSLAWLANGLLGMAVHHRERFAVWILLGASTSIQLICWYAALRIVG